MAEDENNSVDLSHLSIEQIKEMYKDVLDFPSDLITKITTCDWKATDSHSSFL